MLPRVLGCFAVLMCCGSALSGTATLKHLRRSVGEPNVHKTIELPRDEWVLQRLDHFDPTNPGTWWQRYQTNSTWFKTARNSPVFLMIGGEGEASAKWVVMGSWMDYAQKYNALCFQLEHRFYGKSQPKNDLSVENLRYLSSEQALADIAYFIEFINQKYRLNENNKWVVFGGSYPGSLAAWARMKYPHLIHAAVSSSGPLLAEGDFRGYDEVVRKSLATSSELCAKNVHQAAVSLEDLLETLTNTTELSEQFKLCQPLDIDNKYDVSNFAESLAGNFQGVVQYNKDNRITSGGPLPPTVDDLCEIMTDNNLGDLLDRYAAVNTKLMGTQKCLSISYYEYIREMRELSYQATQGARSWIYQTCTEFGFYQTSSSRSELFGSLFNLQFFIDQCKDIFGDDFDRNRLNEGMKRSNVIYGKKNIVVSRVVFVQGSLDPWHVLGISESTNPDAPAILIEGTAHCANMYPSSPHDPPQLVAARKKIVELLGEWLAL